MQLENLAWILIFAVVVHLFEERLFGWIPWAKRYLGCLREWRDFDFLAVCFLPLLVLSVLVSSKMPILLLGIATFGLIDCFVFHFLISIYTREISPGLVTAVFVYLPTAIAILCSAYFDPKISNEILLMSSLLGVFTVLSLRFYIRHPANAPWKLC